MANLTLYTNPMSRGRMARWMLEEVGQPYDAVVLDYGTTMKSPAYLALNPMGKVPTLVHGDTVVTEVAAVVSYLAMAFPEAGLLPADKGHFLRWMFFAAGPVEAAVTNRALGVEVPAERKGMVGYGDFDRVMGALMGLLAKAPYLAGDRFSALDVYLGSQIAYGQRFGSMPAVPEFQDYAARILSRPAAVKAAALDDALIAAAKAAKA
jgi:glutathione S-transferase